MRYRFVYRQEHPLEQLQGVDIQDEIMFNLEQIVASYHDIQYRSGIQDRKGHRTGRRTN